MTDTDHDDVAPSPAEAGDIGALRILLVEDSSHMRSILATILRSFGVKQLKEAEDVETGLDYLKHWKPDIVFLDLLMMGSGGIDFARAVRNWRDSPTPEIPIIVVSANSESSRVAEARDAGVNEFLAKPIRPSDVWKRLVSVIYSNRPFIRTDLYHGPDRRRRSDDDYAGPFKRRSDAVRGNRAAVEIL